MPANWVGNQNVRVLFKNPGVLLRSGVLASYGCCKNDREYIRICPDPHRVTEIYSYNSWGPKSGTRLTGLKWRHQQGCAPSGGTAWEPSLPLVTWRGCHTTHSGTTSVQSLPPWSHWLLLFCVCSSSASYKDTVMTFRVQPGNTG